MRGRREREIEVGGWEERGESGLVKTITLNPNREGANEKRQTRKNRWIRRIGARDSSCIVCAC